MMGLKKKKEKEQKIQDTKDIDQQSMYTQSISVLMKSEINNESMVKKQIRRVQDEQQAKKERQNEKSNIIAQQLEMRRPMLYTFDKSNLPPVHLPQIPYKMRPNEHQESARVVMETRIIQNLIQSYFDLTKKNIADMVPKIIMAFLVHKSQELANSQLVEKVYKGNDLEQLIVEDPMIKA